MPETSVQLCDLGWLDCEWLEMNLEGHRFCVGLVQGANTHMLSLLAEIVDSSMTTTEHVHVSLLSELHHCQNWSLCHKCLLT